MNLSDINFLTSLNVMRLWNISTIVTQINQARFTDMNNLLIWRTQSFYHKLFLANNHTYSNMTSYVISACYSAEKLHACTYNLKTHQHIFITSAKFVEPWQNLDKVFKTSMRFTLLQQGNTLGLLRTGGILEGGWCHDVITWHVHRPLIRVR